MPRPDAHMDPNRGHIDPGNPPASRYPDGLSCHSSNDDLDPRMDANPDPINRPRGMPKPEPVHTYHPQRVEVVPVNGIGGTEFWPGGLLEEGPNYAKAEEEEEPSLCINLSIDPMTIPTRTSWILNNVVPTALRSFIRHNLRYRDTDEKLGLQGQFAEIYHITAKLKRQIWDRRNPESATRGEVQEQLESLIGHALLALDLLEKGNKDGSHS